MAEAKSLLYEEEVDENLLLVEFYQEHDFWLRNVYLKEVPPKLKLEIAILFVITTKEDDNDWMIFLQKLGLPYFFIGAIQWSKGAPPLFTAFKHMDKENLGNVMDVFAKMKKFHILLHVKPYVEGLLKEGKNLVQATAPLLPMSSGTKITEEKYEAAKESDQLQQSLFLNLPKLQKIRENLPSNDKRILVFIQHVLSEKKYATRLAADLWEKGFRVLLSDDIYPFLRMNLAKILTALYRKVDFIVPLLSDELWRQINSRTNSEVDFETKSNRFLHDLALREYSTLLKNYRVRPVLTRKINVRIANDSILSDPFYLRDEFSQFIKNLKEAKPECDRIKKFYS